MSLLLVVHVWALSGTVVTFTFLAAAAVVNAVAVGVRAVVVANCISSVVTVAGEAVCCWLWRVLSLVLVMATAV